MPGAARPRPEYVSRRCGPPARSSHSGRSPSDSGRPPKVPGRSRKRAGTAQTVAYLLTLKGSCKNGSLSNMTPRNARHISSTVRSPHPTGTVGLLGFFGLLIELSYTEVTFTVEPDGITTGLAGV